MDTACMTKYPIVLIHGVGFRDLKWPVYWGGIPGALTGRGASVHYGLQDSWGGVETNAAEISRRIDEITGSTGCGRVNIIAHSKGGIDVRRAAAMPDTARRIASVTTIAAPHGGSAVIDRLLKAPKPLFGAAAFTVDNWIRIIGDKKPDFLAVCGDFSTQRMRDFNACFPEIPGAFCQSFACVMSRPWSDINLSTANLIVGGLEGENDGLVCTSSARWGERYTILRGAGTRGVSHLDAIDLRRTPLKIVLGGETTDICGVYVDIVRNLKGMGL